MDYTNSPLDTSQLITLLKSRGLAIVNETAAESFLDNVSYFRLAATAPESSQFSVDYSYSATRQPILQRVQLPCLLA